MQSSAAKVMNPSGLAPTTGIGMAISDEANKAKVYKVKVSLYRLKIIREMEVRGSSSLYEFAEAITGAFGFNMHHAFGFYNNLKEIYSSSEAYTSFFEDGSKIMAHEKSVRNSHVYEVFQPNKKMLFYYDFSDCWEFIVECRGIIDAVEYPRVTKKKGDAPPQYQICSDDEYGEDEDLEQD